MTHLLILLLLLSCEASAQIYRASGGQSAAQVAQRIVDSLANMKAGVYNVKDLGAKLDGVTDDWAALNAASAAANATHGKVIIPAGKLYADFRSHATITLSDSVTIEGSGRNTVIVTNRTHPTESLVLFTVASGAHVTVKNLTIIGPDSGAYTTQGITFSATTNGGTLWCDNVHLSRWYAGIKGYGDNQNLTVLNSLIDSCAQGIQISNLGTVAGNIYVENTDFQDGQPWWQHHEQLYHFHGMYADLNNNITVRGSRFTRITGYGIEVGGAGDITQTIAGGVHIYSDNVFKDCQSGGIHTGSKLNKADVISNCTVECDSTTANAVLIYEGNVKISNCTFRVGNVAVAQNYTFKNGIVEIDHTTFYLKAGQGINADADGVMNRKFSVTNSRFFMDGSAAISAIYMVDSMSTLDVSHCEFTKTGGAQMCVGVECRGGTVNIDHSIFTTTIDVIPRPTSGSPVVMDLSHNTFNGVSGVYCQSGNLATLTLTGSENKFGSGQEFVDAPSSATRNIQLANRSVRYTGTVNSATTITLWRNFNTYSIAGTTGIDSIQYASDPQDNQFGASHIYLIMASTAAFGNTKNIVPANTSARTANQVVHLMYDTVGKKWLEIY